MKKFKNMQGYNIAINNTIILKKNAKKSDIEAYMAQAELLGLVSSQTAQAIIELGTERGLERLYQEQSNERDRRDQVKHTKPEYLDDNLKDENQKWSDVM
jgi:hypothetical protein